MNTLTTYDWKLCFGYHKLAVINAFETDYVKQLLERHRGNLSAAAREAVMDRKHLSDLAKKHGLR